MRAISIGSVTFDRKQYYINEFDSQGVSAESIRTIDGGAIVYEQLNKDSVKDVILGSKSNYPIGETNLKALQTLVDGSLGRIYPVEFDDGSVINVRFKNESKVLEVEEMTEGSCLFLITLNLAKV